MSKKTHLPVYHNTLSSAEISVAWEAQLREAAGRERFVPRHESVYFERFARIYPQLCALPRQFRRHLQRSLSTSLAGVALLLALGNTPPAFAAQIRVNTNIPDINPDGRCSLIEAIINANDDTVTHMDCLTGNGTDTIVLPTDSTHTLTTPFTTGPSIGLPRITSAITIEANGATLEREASAPPFTILTTEASGNLIINDATISGANYPGYGIKSIDVRSAATINNCTFSDNYIGIEISGGMATINNSTIISEDYGTGVLNFGTTTINSSNISGGGIGLGNYAEGVMNVYNSTVSGSGTGFHDGYSGGGTITNCTIGGRGAGIDSYGGGNVLTVINSTITGNAVGVYSYYSKVSLERTLVSGNRIREVSNYSKRPEDIIANNFNLFGHDGVSNAEAFDGFTPGLTDITATADGTQPTALNNILDITLRNNGGPTKTHALVRGSPAIDAAGPDCPPPNTDQRGVTRPKGMACDIGAFEFKESVGPEKPDLVIYKVDHPDPITVNRPLTYTLTVRNAGMVTARRVRVLDFLPRSVKLLSIPKNCKAHHKRLSCTLGDLDSGAERSLKIVVKPREKGKIVNRARVRFKGRDADPRDNRVKQVTTVTRR